MTRSVILILIVALLSGCSVKRMAANAVGDAVSGGGGVWSSDNDPDLVKEALPFALKTNESLLEVTPEHEGLLRTTAFGFTAYAFLLQQEADRIEGKDRHEARRLRARARNLYLRGRDYALTGLEHRHDGFAERLRKDRAGTLAGTGKEDIPFLYWAGASWAGALGVAKDDLNLVAEFPTAGALVGRALELDPSWDEGAAHEFFISYEAGRPGGSLEAARGHYEKALELSKGERASVFLALAEAVAVPEQDVGLFREMLARAMAVDPEAREELRLVNVIAQRRAEWLKGQIPELFLVTE